MSLGPCIEWTFSIKSYLIYILPYSSHTLGYEDSYLVKAILDFSMTLCPSFGCQLRSDSEMVSSVTTLSSIWQPQNLLICSWYQTWIIWNQYLNILSLRFWRPTLRILSKDWSQNILNRDLWSTDTTQHKKVGLIQRIHHCKIFPSIGAYLDCAGWIKQLLVRGVFQLLLQQESFALVLLK